MANLYGNKLWAEFREKIISLDGGVCITCGRSRADGVVMQVHHKRYITGRKPWEYDTSDCETLCRGCHAREHGEIRPASGWQYFGEDDLEDLIGTCDLCGSTIRFVHHVQHEHWEPMGVGTVCCDNLTGTEEATTARRRLGRLKRFIVSDRWIYTTNSHEINFKNSMSLFESVTYTVNLK
ncbi:HNH endonuclease [Chromobacterium vaccinii]|uniref:HNH endonuclease n=1 Tax=Chromobacterium vaccinii TaxID=1108595 RepID=UPI0011C0780E|nr:HNH endonuclease [Chromobacterium vaccinii]